MGAIRLWIEDQPYRKGNNRTQGARYKKNDGTIGTRSIKSPEALQWTNNAIMRCPPELKGLLLGSAKNPLFITFTVYYRDRKPDLSIELVLDALGKGTAKHPKMGVISDDRHVYGYRARKQFDKRLQGVMIEIEEMTYIPHYPASEGLIYVIGGTGQVIHLARKDDRHSWPICGADDAARWVECHRVKGQPLCEKCARKSLE